MLNVLLNILKIGTGLAAAFVSLFTFIMMTSSDLHPFNTHNWLVASWVLLLSFILVRKIPSYWRVK
jgi:hypothetical protein